MKQFLPALLLIFTFTVYQAVHGQQQEYAGSVTMGDMEISCAFTPVSIDPQFQAGDTAWQGFLKRNLVYPKSAKEYGIEGKVTVQFIVSKEGYVTEAWALDGHTYLWQSAVDVVMKSPKWIPAIQNGRLVKGYKKTIVEFKLDEDAMKAKKARYAEDSTEVIFIPMHFEGEFAGGDSAWVQFIKRELVVSKEAMGRVIQSYVTVGFILDKFGNVMDVIPFDGPPALWQSAMDAVCRSPKWSPAIQGGRQVKAYKKRVIEFKLDRRGERPFL